MKPHIITLVLKFRTDACINALIIRSFAFSELSGALYIHTRSRLWFMVLADIHADSGKLLRILSSTLLVVRVPKTYVRQPRSRLVSLLQR